MPPQACRERNGTAPTANRGRAWRTTVMARAGRKPFRLKHLKKLAVSPLVKTRLEWLLKSLSGECTVPEACAALGINESRFHKLRSDWLQASAERLEPGRPGRRAQAKSPETRQIIALEDKVRSLEVQLRAAEVRAELAQALPQVVRAAGGAGKKRPRPARLSRPAASRRR
jgi:hypothetical protein